MSEDIINYNIKMALVFLYPFFNKEFLAKFNLPFPSVALSINWVTISLIIFGFFLSLKWVEILTKLEEAASEASGKRMAWFSEVVNIL